MPHIVPAVRGRGGRDDITGRQEVVSGLARQYDGPICDADRLGEINAFEVAGAE
ncbi:MAG: hypothetical protein ABFS86_17370 [Planctomycetota bacterium]